MADGSTIQSNRLSSDSPQSHLLETATSPTAFAVPKWARYLVYLLLAIMILSSVMFAIRGYQNAPKATIYINPQGLSAAQYSALKRTMGAQAPGNYFNSDLQSLRNIALGLSWVDEVSLARDWQRGIIVTALPKEAVARFGTERLVDAKGEVFVPASGDTQANSSLTMLQGNNSQAPVIMQQMQQINTWFEPLGVKVVDIILTPRMTWLIRFDDGLRVIVDNENTAQKLINLSQLLQQQLSSKRADIQSVDLRYKNGFTIAWKPKSQDIIAAQ